MFDKAIVLTVNKRVGGNSSDQQKFRDLLFQLRNGDSSEDDWKLLLTRQSSEVTQIKEFENSTRLYFSNAEVATYNYAKLKELKMPIAIVHAKHNNKTAKNINSQDMSGLEAIIHIATGAHVMVTVNLWTSVGLCNGAKGIIKHILYQANHKPPDLPIAVIVQFENYTGPSFAGIANGVPIPPITVSFDSGNCIYERQQLPLKLAWALTIHKSQGLTLPKCWVDIGKNESILGITYVAISRVKTLSSLIIEPVTFDRLRQIKKKAALVYRQKEEEQIKLIVEESLNTKATPIASKGVMFPPTL
jgi:hypothetical protein